MYLKGHLAGEVRPQHDHPCHPEEQDVVTSLEQVCRVQALVVACDVT